MDRRDCIRCGKYEQASELGNGLCWDCATREDAPADPFSEVETQDLLAKFFHTDKPILHADDSDLDRISNAAWEVLQRSNINPVSIFRVGSVPSRLETDDDAAPVIRALTVERLRQEMAVRACWYKGLRGDELLERLFGVTPGDEEWSDLHKKNSTARPPRDVIQNMLAMPEIPLPVLERIVEAPVYGPDGTVETRPGYHPSSRTYYAGNEIELQPVSVDPSHTEVARAVDIIGELLNDFPFTSEADRLIAIAAMEGPFVRSLIDGSTPLHLLEAPTPGTGKGLLADVTYTLAGVALYEAVCGEIGGEVHFVAGDRQQASRAFGEIRKIVEADEELRGLFTFYKHSAEVASTGTVLRVLSADAGLQLGLEPSFVVADEVAVMTTGCGTR